MHGTRLQKVTASWGWGEHHARITEWHPSFFLAGSTPVNRLIAVQLADQLKGIWASLSRKNFQNEFPIGSFVRCDSYWCLTLFLWEGRASERQKPTAMDQGREDHVGQVLLDRQLPWSRAVLNAPQQAQQKLPFLWITGI